LILLIERDWYQLGQYNLNKNLCSKCSHPIAGRFEDQAGNWGQKRRAVRIGE
jgi:pyruvate formate lyase activating enzyme